MYTCTPVYICTAPDQKPVYVLIHCSSNCVMQLTMEISEPLISLLTLCAGVTHPHGVSLWLYAKLDVCDRLEWKTTRTYTNTNARENHSRGSQVQRSCESQISISEQICYNSTDTALILTTRNQEKISLTSNFPFIILFSCSVVRIFCSACSFMRFFYISSLRSVSPLSLQPPLQTKITNTVT